MATQLNQILSFIAVGAGANAALPHNINIQGQKLLPDLLFPDNEGFSLVSATTTTITVVNNTGAPATLNLWLNRQHTIDRAYGAKTTTNLSPQPLWVGGGGSGGGGGGDVTELTLLNGNAGAVVVGAPVFSSGAGTFDKARANALATAFAIGLVAQVPSIGIGASGLIKTMGPFALTTVQWDAVVTGGAGGLVFNTPYFVDPATAGKLTTVAPVVGGQVVEYIGIGVSPTTMIINPALPVLL